MKNFISATILCVLSNCVSLSGMDIGLQCNQKQIGALSVNVLKMKGQYKKYAYKKFGMKEFMVKRCNGLYFLQMPSKKTRFMCNVPVLVHDNRYFVNYYAFDGKIEIDSSGSKKSISNIINFLRSDFSSTEIDSIASVFEYGGYVNLKDGNYLR
jgi:hypothetical protein